MNRYQLSITKYCISIYKYNLTDDYLEKFIWNSFPQNTYQRNVKLPMYKKMMTMT